MRIVMIFHLDDSAVQEIVKQDKRDTDILDEINNLAKEEWPLDVWHFSDRAYGKIHAAMAERYEWMKSGITETLTGE